MDEDKELEAAILGAQHGAPPQGGSNPPPPANDPPPPPANNPPPPPANNPPPAAPPAVNPPAPAAGAPPAPPAEGAPKADGANPPPAPPPPAPSPDETFLKTFHGGKYSSTSALQEDINRLTDLESKLDHAIKNPSFASERAKQAWEWANKFEGMQPEAIRSFMHVVTLPVDKLSDQQLRFEAFRLDPQYMGYPEQKLWNFFREQDVAKYGDPENKEAPPSENQQFSAEIATKQSRESIAKLQKSYTEAKPASAPPADDAAERLRIRTNAEQSLAAFKEINFSFKVPGENGENVDGALKFAVDQSMLKSVIDGTANPLEMWEAEMAKAGAIDAKGNVDLAKFGKVVAEFVNRNKIVESAYRQGHNDGQAYKVKNARNPGGGGDNPPPPPGPANVSGRSDNDLMGEAMYNAFKKVGT